MHKEGETTSTAFTEVTGRGRGDGAQPWGCQGLAGAPSMFLGAWGTR